MAKLKIANTTNGEKVLYDVHPVEKVGQGRTLPTIPTDDKIPQDITESQEKLSDREIRFGRLIQERINDNIADNGTRSSVDLLAKKSDNYEGISYLHPDLHFYDNLR